MRRRISHSLLLYDIYWSTVNRTSLGYAKWLLAPMRLRASGAGSMHPVLTVLVSDPTVPNVVTVLPEPNIAHASHCILVA